MGHQERDDDMDWFVHCRIGSVCNRVCFGRSNDTARDACPALRKFRLNRNLPEAWRKRRAGGVVEGGGTNALSPPTLEAWLRRRKLLPRLPKYLRLRKSWG